MIETREEYTMKQAKKLTTVNVVECVSTAKITSKKENIDTVCSIYNQPDVAEIVIFYIFRHSNIGKLSFDLLFGHDVSS